MNYPTIKTTDYDTTCRYEEGMEVYLRTFKHGSPPNHTTRQFTTQVQDSRTTQPIAVVRKPPTEDNPELELMLVGEDWDLGGYERHKILREILGQRQSQGADAKIVVVPYDVFDLMMQHCVDAFEPAVRSEDLHRGKVYGLLVYTSYATQQIQVF
jgi:hypothetical protein